ncbi:MAG: EAL domain-containing protein [Thermoanaerobaculia bacterium]|nr:EAL domain-containing protein [Thermoanaerobaculia bacterium]
MASPTIVLVDDEETNLELLEALLVDAGYEVEKATDGRVALERIREVRPDLVITDILMPTMDGYQLCRELKASPELRSIPLIFYTATYTDPEDRELALSLGASRFLVKPEPADRLKRTIREVLEEHREEGSGASPALSEEPAYLRKYNRRLVAKLEDKLQELDETNRRLREEVAEREQAEARVRHLAYYDSLTDLPNRTKLLELMKEAFDGTDEHGSTCSLLVIDVDRFRDINHTLGHRNGDRLLRLVKDRLETVTDEDGDILARLGADEFALLRCHGGAGGSPVLARRIIDAFERPFDLDGIQIHISVSVGISRYPAHGADPALLLRHAEVAMHGVKGHRGSISVYTPEEDPYEPRRLEMISGIREAIRTDELLLHYQPKVELREGRTVGAEALVRWRHPDHGFLPPESFIGLVEQTGQIRALTHWLIRRALVQYSEWRAAGLDLRLSMNLSARNLADEDFPQAVAELFREEEIQRPAFTLEMTESAILQDPPRARSILERLADLGLDFAIDDFGTGYSSLSNLKQLPVSELKIDKSFVAGLVEDENDAVIVRSTIDLAHNLGLRVTAEGVETEAVWTRLRELECDMAQGFYMARPMPPDQLERWIGREPWSGRKS